MSYGIKATIGEHSATVFQTDSLEVLMSQFTALHDQYPDIKLETIVICDNDNYQGPIMVFNIDRKPENHNGT